MNTQALVETPDRERCPHCHTLLFRGTRQCWMCEKTPEEWAQTSDIQEVPVLAVVDSKPEVDVETGEISATGQLTIMGIDVPSVRVQRKADLGMTLNDFNATDWEIRDGDRLSVSGKDGLLIVKLTKAWEQQ